MDIDVTFERFSRIIVCRRVSVSKHVPPRLRIGMSKFMRDKLRRNYTIPLLSGNSGADGVESKLLKEAQSPYTQGRTK